MSALWTEKHIAVNPFSRCGRKKDRIAFLVYHYTANPGASAEAHFNYLQGLAKQNPNDNTADRYASAELFVDRDSAVEYIPLEEEAFHAGNRWYNRCAIGVELCIEPDGSFHPDTIKRAIQIGAYLCTKYDIDPIKGQIRHYDVTGKICPKPWVEKPGLFQQFKRDVASAMKGAYKMTPDDANKIITTYLKPAWGAAKQKEDQAEMKEAARLADELRKASNQPTQNG